MAGICRDIFVRVTQRDVRHIRGESFYFINAENIPALQGEEDRREKERETERSKDKERGKKVCRN